MEQLTKDAEEGAPVVRVRWRSFELRPAGAPPMPPEYRERIEASRPQLYTIARDRYQRTMNPGPFGVDSRVALVGEKVAEGMGRGNDFHEAVMRAYWSDALDISDRAVLVDCAVAAGLDGALFAAALDDPAYDRMVQADVDLARSYGLNGVPAMVFNDKYLVSGAQPADVLRQVVERIAQESTSGA